jgi:micrococcal nuclease
MSSDVPIENARMGAADWASDDQGRATRSGDKALLRYKLGFGALVVLTVACVAWIAAMVAWGDLDEPSSSESAPSRAESSPTVPIAQSDDSEMPPGDVPGAAERARVVGHVDGDTLRLAPVNESRYLPAGEETKVRLLEIDTPESVDPNSPEECYSARSSRALSEMLPLGEMVWIKSDRQLLDPYGRTLLYLWTTDGRFVNLEMVRRGFAKAVLYEPNDEYIDIMRRAERRARQANRGLWGACDFFGQPRGFAQVPTEAVTSSSPPTPPSEPGTDPRFQSCSDANDAGYGNYVSGRDPEYDWYDDRDSDGIVCEY